MLTIDGVDIRRVGLIDDEPEVRNTYRMTVEDLELEAVCESGPLPPLESFLVDAQSRADAAICDFKLRIVGNYATFDGAELAARWFDLGFPAILCTRWDDASIDGFRKYRAKVPTLIKPGDLDTDSIAKGFEVCLHEMRGKFLNGRKPHRTLVRIEELPKDSLFCYVVVPAWDPSKVLRLHRSDLPTELLSTLCGGSRLYAEVNLGAEGSEELYFKSWTGR